MDTSLFAKLPREMRDEIWKLAIVVPDRCQMFRRKRRFKLYIGYDDDSRGSRNDFPWTDWRQDKAVLLAITKTCKQIHRETSPLVYSAIRFEAPVHFTPFGLKFGHKQARVYAHGLSLSRKWLKTIGMLNSQAISRFELDLGTWMLGGIAPTQTNKRGWWFGARNMERKQLMPMLRQSALYIRIGVSISNSLYHRTDKRWDDFDGFRNYMDRWCKQVKTPGQFPERLQFVISTADLAQARENIEQAYEAKLGLIKEHVEHERCEAAQMISSLRREYKRARDVMLNAVGIRVDGDDGSLGLDGMHL